MGSNGNESRFCSHYWGLLATLLVLFFLGGSSRPDVYSLLVLGPIIIFLGAVALTTLPLAVMLNHKFSFGAFGIFIFLAAFHSFPFTDFLRPNSPGFIVIDTVRRETGLSSFSNSLGLSSHIPVASILFLFGPLSVYLFAVQLKREELLLTLPAVALLGILSATLGLLQMVGGRNASFYLYQVTNDGSVVGLFANRNHAAVFLSCLFPVCAIFAAGKGAGQKFESQLTPLLSVSGALLLILLILITGSRAGILTGATGILGAMFLYSSTKKLSRDTKTASGLSPSTLILLLSLFASPVLLAIYFARALAVERLFQGDSVASVRAGIWDASYPLFWNFFPLGFGAGSFGAVFQNTEPLGLLSSMYVNRVHNDWVETGLTFGVPGIIVMLVGVVYYLHRSFVLWMRMDGQLSAVAFGRMASIIIAILSIASLGDYPLRTPAMAGFAALVVVWFVHARPLPNVG